MNLPLSSPARGAPDAGALDRARAHIMAVSLKSLLDRVRGSRDALPHLAALESALRLEGLESLERASLPGLSRICSQLASLPVADNDAPLQDLQTRLLQAMERRSRPWSATEAPSQHPPPQPHAPVLTRTAPPPPTPHAEPFGSAVVVSEMTHSAFMLVMQEPEVTVPTPLSVGAGTPVQPR